MPEVLAEIQRRGYDHILTTGTIREAAYYLLNGDTLICTFDPPFHGEVRANLSGRDGAYALFMTEEDTLGRIEVTADNREYTLQCPRSMRELRMISGHYGLVPDDAANVFLKHLTINGENIHVLQRKMRIAHAEGPDSPGRPDFAEALAFHLRNAGAVPSRITALPSTKISGGRTWSNAVSFARYAQDAKLTSVDVLSMGVHARRSRHMYRSACGNGTHVGVVSVPDPLASPDNWWRHRIGWTTVLKEILGLPGLFLFRNG
ncbi:MAG: hypothetical protein KDB95_15215 [Flavobacteriales bacterium]|nr:hypothetical protein [Flavobacteriales bacterium]